MKLIHAGWAVAALVLSAPAFAQTAVQSSTGATVSSGTGVVVTPGVPSAVVTAPATTVVVAPSASLHGATVAQVGTTETVNGNTRTVVTRYWVNVPAGVERDADFQRWQRLR
jgi:hypothetical protein